MGLSEQKIIRLSAYLRQLSSQVRSRLLIEMERLALYEEEVPGADVILKYLRAELRTGGQNQPRSNDPGRYFFLAHEPFLVDLPPERAGPGQISRGSLTTIWNWISQSLMPAMALTYADEIKLVTSARNRDEAARIAKAFQDKVTPILHGTIVTPEGITRVRGDLAAYTSLHATYDDFTKIVGVLRGRDALAQLDIALPTKIMTFDDQPLAKVRTLLDAFTAKTPDALPFALVLVAKRLSVPWQLIRLATSGASSKKAADIAARPYAATVSMVLDHLDNRRLALRDALKTRVVIAQDILTEIYDIEDALRARIDNLDRSDWGRRLDGIMAGVADLIDNEVQGITGGLRHVLKSRTARRQQTSARGLASAVTGARAYCRKLLGGRASARG